jgi:hypothetical protein
MKQKSRRARSVAAKIRSKARKLLKESGEMPLTEVQKEIEQSWDTRLRSDYLRNSLVKIGSGIEINLDTEPVTVSLNNPIRKEMKRAMKKAKAKSKKQQHPITPEEFTLRAIKSLSKPPHKAIHVVYSGFNAAFRAYFPGLNPITELQRLERAGKVSIRPAKGGAIIFAGGAQQGKFSGADEALRKMGLS